MVGKRLRGCNASDWSVRRALAEFMLAAAPQRTGSGLRRIRTEDSPARGTLRSAFLRSALQAQSISGLFKHQTEKRSGAFARQPSFVGEPLAEQDARRRCDACVVNCPYGAPPLVIRDILFALRRRRCARYVDVQITARMERIRSTSLISKMMRSVGLPCCRPNRDHRVVRSTERLRGAKLNALRCTRRAGRKYVEKGADTSSFLFKPHLTSACLTVLKRLSTSTAPCRENRATNRSPQNSDQVSLLDTLGFAACAESLRQYACASFYMPCEVMDTQSAAGTYTRTGKHGRATQYLQVLSHCRRRPAIIRAKA